MCFISHVAELKIMASQALFLIHKHLSHFLYLRKACQPIDFQGHIHIVAPKIVSTKHGGFFPHRHSTCRWPGCYEDCWFVATCATPAVCPVSPEMMLIFRQCWPDLHPCVVMQKKKSRSGMIHSCLPALTGSHGHRPLQTRGIKEMEHNLSW